MAGEISTLERNAFGLYDLRIVTKDGQQLLHVQNVTFKRAVALIEQQNNMEASER